MAFSGEEKKTAETYLLLCEQDDQAEQIPLLLFLMALSLRRRSGFSRISTLAVESGLLLSLYPGVPGDP
jgi:hypothetical protein